MAAAGEPTTAGKRKNRVVVWAGGGGGGGGLLLLGGALAATAALGVAFIVRAATKRKTEKAKGSLQEAEGEKKGSDMTCSREGRAEEGEESGGLSSLLPPPPPPPQASLPPPKEEENSSLKREQTLTGANPSAVSEASGADGSSATVGEGATVQKSVFVRAEEKIIKENSLIRDAHGEGVDDVSPAIVNKDVVVDESKIIQVVGGEAPLEETVVTAPADGSAREGEEEKEGGLPVEEGAEKSSGGTGDPSVAEAEPPWVARPAKTMEPSLPSVEVIQTPKPVVMMTIKKEEVFLGTGQKLGVEVAEAPWKANRMVAEMREKGVMDRMVVEMREKRFSGNAQVVILVSTVFFTTLLAILLHHYGGRLLESTLV